MCQESPSPQGLSGSREQVKGESRSLPPGQGISHSENTSPFGENRNLDNSSSIEQPE